MIGIELILAGCSGLLVASIGFIFNNIYTNRRNAEKITELEEKYATQWNATQAMAMRHDNAIKELADDSELKELERKFDRHLEESAHIRADIAALQANVNNLTNSVNRALDKLDKSD